MKKTYLIVGDNNFWYTLLYCTKDELQNEIKDVKKRIKAGEFDDQLNTDGDCEMLFVYEAKRIEGITL